MTTQQPTFRIIMLATAQTDHYSALPITHWQKYADKHGYDFSVCRERLVSDMHMNWSKIEMVRQRLADSDHDYLLLVDADTIVMSPQTRLVDLVKEHRQIVFSADNPFPRLTPDMRHLALRLKLRRLTLPNAGFILIANTAFNRKFFDDWMDLARGPLACFADTHPRNQNVLWRGLLNRHRNEVALYKREILRLTMPRQLARLKHYRPFAVHFKHENITADALLPHIKN